jgi:hypothetical protein
MRWLILRRRGSANDLFFYLGPFPVSARCSIMVVP